MTVTLQKVAMAFAGAGFAICGGVLALAEKIAAPAWLFKLGIVVGVALSIGGGTYVLKDLFHGILSSKERAEIIKRARQVFLASLAAFIICYVAVFWLLGITFRFEKDEPIASVAKPGQAQATSPKPPEDRKAGPSLTGAPPRTAMAEDVPSRPEQKMNPEENPTGQQPPGRELQDRGANGISPISRPALANNATIAAAPPEEPAKAPALAAAPSASTSMGQALANPPARPATPQTFSLYRNDPRAICGIQLMKLRPSSPLKPSPTGWLLYSDDFLTSFSEKPLVLDESFKVNDCIVTLKRIDPDGRWFEFEMLQQR